MNKNKKIILLILALSALTRFAFFGHPNQTVFDEVHFGKFISGYFTGQYFFDIHPPLGKLLISGMGYLTGFQPGFSFANIGETFPDRHYLWLRFLPTLAGALLPLVIFLLAQTLGFSRKASLLAGLLTVFENALLVQSRFILLDSFLLLFGFSALLFYFKYRPPEVQPRELCLTKVKPWSDKGLTLGLKWLILSGLTAGLAASVKWTGLSFLGIILILELASKIKTIIQRRSGDTFSSAVEKKYVHRSLSKSLWQSVFGLILIPLAIYTSIFALHFYLLPKSGPGDAFMSAEFQKTLAGNVHHQNSQASTLSFVGKFTELNKQMYSSNQRITATHPYGSKWHSWPFLSRSVFFWQDTTHPREEKIYLLGNPLIWWAGSIAMILLIVKSIKKVILRKATWRRGTLFASTVETKSSSPEPWDSSNFTENFLLLGFFINLLPFIGIGRVMFLYHYFPSLIFTILTLAYLANKANKKSLFAFLTVISVAGFLYFSPLTYGLPLSPQIQNYLFWFANWR
ncbi:MAG: dolichyl-phosphate-mannose-protein mannosyltransferase [Parcubacteria group bacterium Gr01-1014_44]|nr:MAG: dolichyl-phosphate-mannose-protein mannosyltransferase [Parcubacteria group bacterium Gr01-1014_44]